MFPIQRPRRNRRTEAPTALSRGGPHHERPGAHVAVPGEACGARSSMPTICHLSDEIIVEAGRAAELVSPQCLARDP